MTDADTIANAELLWKLVHDVQDTIDKTGESQLADERKALCGKVVGGITRPDGVRGRSLLSPARTTRCTFPIAH